MNNKRIRNTKFEKHLLIQLVAKSNSRSKEERTSEVTGVSEVAVHLSRSASIRDSVNIMNIYY